VEGAQARRVAPNVQQRVDFRELGSSSSAAMIFVVAQLLAAITALLRCRMFQLVVRFQGEFRAKPAATNLAAKWMIR